MKIPGWVSWSGLVLHLVAGAAVAWALRHSGVTYLPRLEAVAYVGLAHEIGDRDVLPAAVGWPWNGAIDVLAFVLGAVLLR